MTTPEEIKAEYASSLADLTFNSKPLINVLTMLADENSPNAKVIVEAIETHLSKVAIDVKLPILYLVDCIVKNVGGTYTTLFSQNIVSTFCGVFKVVDERTRAEMYKLRQTWNDVFPQMKLYAIDVQINLLDPAWPVTAKLPSNSIHFNPKFLKTNTPSAKPKTESDSITTTAPSNIDKETLLMQEKLIQKQKELLELQQKKLELEVLQTKVKLQEQIKGSGGPTSIPVRPQNILLKPEVAKQLVPQLKQKPIGINSTSARQQRPGGVNSRIHPVSNSLIAAVSSKPIRDPRLLKQQQQQQQKLPDNSSNVQLGTKTAMLESNKIVANKTGGRKIRTDPRVINKNNVQSHKTDKPTNPNNKSLIQKSHKSSRSSPRANSDSSSTKSGSSSSLDSPNKSGAIKSDKQLKSPVRQKKKDKSEDAVVKKLDGLNEQKRDKIKVDSSGSPLKSVKSTKTRNYARRNLGIVSPLTTAQDEDLRSLAPPEKQPKLHVDLTDEQSGKRASPAKGMDVDLRQLPPPAVIGKKRPSIDSPEHAAVKKTKSNTFDKLFGDEDTDLRQFSIQTDRPPTPPPPIISTGDIPKEIPESPKSNLDAVRAKLANATNRGAKLNIKRSFKKPTTSEDQDLRIPKKTSPNSGEVANKIIISPEDESSIKSGTLTKEQEAHLFNKIVMQIEINKLKEAKKKDHEESFNVSLQPISDDELQDSEEGENEERSENICTPSDNSVMPFNDKDERLNPTHFQQQKDFVPPPFFPRDGRELPPRRFPQNWRFRGRGRMWDNPPMPRGPIRPWNHPNAWRNMYPAQQRDYLPMAHAEEDVSRSPDISSEQLTNGAVNQDEIKTINIDGMPKDIRFYDETAIAFINWDEPREITFQDDGVRHVVFNDNESYALRFNVPYKEVLINGVAHMVRIGAPSRELFIDYVPYECYFGSSGRRIDINGTSVVVKLEGPPPQVKIGDTKRTDLVAGKINLFIDATTVVPVFLDAKVQKFVINGETSTLQFVNSLETVLINDTPFTVEYGGLPKPIVIHGKKHFIRFSVLPKGIRRGRVVIKDMEGQGNIVDDTSQDNISTATEPYEPAMPVISRGTRVQDSPDRNSNSPSFYQNFLQQQNLNNLDALSNAMTPSFGSNPTTEGYQVENTEAIEDKPVDIPKPNIPLSLNINDLFQKLVASGFVTSGNTKPPELNVPVSDVPLKASTPSVPVTNSSQPVVQKSKRSVYDNLKLISFTKPESLKVRQSPLYSSLYSGMQCSSCGMRFCPEASMQYSQHLDWHFRQNRKGKRNTRVAASRKWYYSLSDWKNYEELEDLEEREKNYFDQQQQQAEGGDEFEEETEIPSVPADPDSTDECCEVCRDKFDQFFNEEKEEWHLRNSVRIEDKTYHPVCYDDHLQSFAEQSADESKTEPMEEDEEEAKTEDSNIPGLEIIIDDDDEEEEISQDASEPAEIVSLESDESKTIGGGPNEENQETPEDDGDDDDVILNEVAPIKIVVDDDDDEYITEEVNENGSMKVKKEKIDDGFVEVAGLVSLQNGGQIKIKAEPVDPDDVALEPVVEQLDLYLEQEKPKDQEFSNATHTELIPSIDGNIEIVSSVPSSVTSSVVSGNKIKINISKSLPVITNKEKDSVPENDFLSETYIDPFEPFPPGEEPEPVSIKPSLQGVKLKKLPPVKKGVELTGLCSIM